jgi:protein SCO1/2
MTLQVLKEHAALLESSPQMELLTGDRDKIYDLANKGFNLYRRK